MPVIGDRDLGMRPMRQLHRCPEAGLYDAFQRLERKQLGVEGARGHLIPWVVPTSVPHRAEGKPRPVEENQASAGNKSRFLAGF